MAAVAASATAMAAVAASATAMAAIMKNSNAKEKFFGANYSVGRGIATYANISNNTLIGLQSMSAVAASATAMSAVAASATAMSAVAASAVALSAVLKSNVAKTAMAKQTNQSVLQGVNSKIIATLANTSYFTKTRSSVRNDAGITVSDASISVIERAGGWGGNSGRTASIKHYADQTYTAGSYSGAYSYPNLICIGGFVYTEVSDAECTDSTWKVV